MKKIILFLLLLSTSGILLAQSTVDVTNTTSAVLDSAGVWQPTSWRNVTGYNSITLTIKSDKSSATNGVKIYWADKVNNLYRIMDSVTTAYTTGSVFSLILPVNAPYLRVKYTNTTSAQTSFSLVLMLHVGQQLSLDAEGKLEIAGSTSNGALEATQLQVLAELQNRINMGGAQTYSLRRQDFTATLKAGGKSIAVTGLNGGTLSYLNFAYGWIINSTTGAKTYLTNAVDSVAGTSIRFPGATDFTASDVLGELVFVYPEKTTDKANDALKVLLQNGVQFHTQQGELNDGINVATGTYFPSSAGMDITTYKTIGFGGYLIDGAGETTTLTFEATCDDDDTDSNAWNTIQLYDQANNTYVSSVAATNETKKYTLLLNNSGYYKIRAKIVTSASTNTVNIKYFGKAL